MSGPAPVGRLIMPALRWSPETGFAHEEPAIAAALEAGAGGFIIFGGPADAVRSLTTSLVARAGRPLLIGSDLERGAGQQFDGLTELPPPRALATLHDLDAVRRAGAITGAEARSVGVNWVFAPVADLDLAPENPIVQTRSFSDDPATAAACVRAWVEGCQDAGALACAKHYPGHGRTRGDSHAELPSVAATAQELAASDAVPFDAAITAGVASVMTAHVAFPALDRAGGPATMSRPILEGLRAGGFGGLIVTDALIMEGAVAGRSEAAASVDAIRAGVDVLLYPKDVRAVAAALASAVNDGALSAARVADAQRRQLAALERAARPAATPDRTGAAALADRLLEAARRRGSLPPLRAPIDLVVVDDDIGGPYPASPSDWLARALGAAGVPLGAGGSRIVLVFSEPRAWKGRAGLGAASKAALDAALRGSDLVVLFGHERLAGEIGGNAPVIVAWHRQRLMQEAVARALAANIE